MTRPSWHSAVLFNLFWLLHVPLLSARVSRCLPINTSPAFARRRCLNCGVHSHCGLVEWSVKFFKCRGSATAPTYLSRYIKARVSERTLRSSGVPLPDKPFTRTDFARRAFRYSAPTVWNSLPESIISADSLPVFKSRLKTCFFRKAFE